MIECLELILCHNYFRVWIWFEFVFFCIRFWHLTTSFNFSKKNFFFSLKFKFRLQIQSPTDISLLGFEALDPGSWMNHSERRREDLLRSRTELWSRKSLPTASNSSAPRQNSPQHIQQSTSRLPVEPAGEKNPEFPLTWIKTAVSQKRPQTVRLSFLFLFQQATVLRTVVLE